MNLYEVTVEITHPPNYITRIFGVRAASMDDAADKVRRTVYEDMRGRVIEARVTIIKQLLPNGGYVREWR